MAVCWRRCSSQAVPYVSNKERCVAPIKGGGISERARALVLCTPCKRVLVPGAEVRLLSSVCICEYGVSLSLCCCSLVRLHEMSFCVYAYTSNIS